MWMKRIFNSIPFFCRMVTIGFIPYFFGMELSALTAISPVDGRYRTQLATLAPYFSEFGLIKYRVRVEVEYFLFLAEKKVFKLPAAAKPAKLRNIYESFTEEDAKEIKKIERTTNHDV